METEDVSSIPTVETSSSSPQQTEDKGLSSHPVRVTCPHCRQNIVSTVYGRPGLKTHLIACLLCMLVCGCCIPYCVQSCQNAEHYCSRCGAYLGTFFI